MKIILENHSISESILEVNKLKWKIFMRKKQIGLSILGLLILIIFAMGLLSRNSYDKFYNGECTIYFNLNLFLSFGIVGLLIVLYIFIGWYRAKSVYTYNSSQLAKKFEHIRTLEYELNDTAITIDTTLTKNVFHWQLFSKKTVVDRIIFLHFFYEGQETVTIDARDFSDSEFKELMAFLHAKIR